MRFAVFTPAGGTDADAIIVQHGRCDCDNVPAPSQCYLMLLTFLFGGDGGRGPAAPRFGAADSVFNGKLRLRALSLREAGSAPARVPGAAGDRIVIFRAIVSNGSRDVVTGNFDAALADADGHTVAGRPLEGDWNLARGSAARTAAKFYLGPDFVPVKLVLIDTAEPDRPAFRFDVCADSVRVLSLLTRYL